ncbi:hypothetical protein C0995_011054 [Termitomyces sp. Mi166|nr:hypothetical protein C0995_011054 [Termitomyces sp. Mi166\
MSSFFANKEYHPQLTVSLCNIPSHIAHKVTHNLQSLQDQYHDLPPPIEVDRENHYKVEKILDFHMYQSKVHYMVQWLGYFSNKPWNLRSQ